ncbi:MAG: hypothetical protein EXQ85_05145 [Alphaproteobacteria bacterium]|nr:hypothetical protein [Alphaproteobacteria bacterium]
MGVQAVTQVLPPFRAGDRAGFAGAAFDTFQAGGFDERVYGPSATRRSAGANERGYQAERRPIEDQPRQAHTGAGRRSTDRRDYFGLHLAVDPYPERVRHSSPFVTQLLDQIHRNIGQPARDRFEFAAYDASNARAESIYGTIESVVVVA